MANNVYFTLKNKKTYTWTMPDISKSYFLSIFRKGCFLAEIHPPKNTRQPQYVAMLPKDFYNVVSLL
jgi:hypothetical protein